MPPLKRFLKFLRFLKASTKEEAKRKKKTSNGRIEEGFCVVCRAPVNLPTVARKPIPVPARKPLPGVAHRHPGPQRHPSRPPVFYRNSMGYFPLEQEENYVPPSFAVSTGGTDERKMKHSHPRQQTQHAPPGLVCPRNPPGYLGGTPYKGRAAQPKKRPPLERQEPTLVCRGAVRGCSESRLRQ